MTTMFKKRPKINVKDLEALPSERVPRFLSEGGKVLMNQKEAVYFEGKASLCCQIFIKPYVRNIYIIKD